MDLLIGIVIAVFIITAVFVGYHASQEPHEIVEGHKEITELKTFGSKAEQSIHIPHHKAVLD